METRWYFAPIFLWLLVALPAVASEPCSTPASAELHLAAPVRADNAVALPVVSFDGLQSVYPASRISETKAFVDANERIAHESDASLLTQMMLSQNSEAIAQSVQPPGPMNKTAPLSTPNAVALLSEQPALDTRVAPTDAAAINGSGQNAEAQAAPQASPQASADDNAEQPVNGGNNQIAGAVGRTTPSPAQESIPPAPAPTPAPATAAAPSTISHSVAKGIMQLLERDFSLPGYTAPVSPPLLRRAPPAPLDPVFPSSEFLGSNAQAPMGVNDNNYAQYPLEQFVWKNCPLIRKYRIRMYGWLNPSVNASTSSHSNYPMSYIVAANQVHWDQVVARIERVPDTVQQEHMDWGFRYTNLYGEDYRFTTAKGWLSNQLLHHNLLTGYDPCEAFAILYTPTLMGHKLFDGVSWRVGRYISCPDIEAQLAPDNYLFTHSLMFTVDTYTQTGIQSWIQLNKYWNVMLGFHSGADTAPWTNSTVPTGQALIRWVSANNKDSMYFGINDINGLPFQNPTGYVPPGSQGKDNLQQVNVNWTHVFNRRFHTVTEAYYLWTRDALRGGTVSDGPVRSFGGGGGPGVFLPGRSDAVGLVNYTLFRVTAKDYLCLRPLDILYDPQGWRTGFRNTYESWTLGWCHRFSDLLCMRPEIRYERAYNTPAYNNGTKQYQLTFSCDLIQRF